MINGSGKSYCSLSSAGVAGVDEAGRGPLAGPVVAAAVILDGTCPLVGLDDSKRLSPSRRLRLAKQIEENALTYCLGWASVREIDELNILRASLLSMQRAISGLQSRPALALVDGNQAPSLPCPVCTVIGGDRRVAAISAASVLAKVARDRHMEELDRKYPGYGFARHKGYPTRDHLRALAHIGVSDCHRRTFRPVRVAATNNALGHEH